MNLVRRLLITGGVSNRDRL